MRLIIDIPEELYEANNKGLEAGEIWDLRMAIKNGKALEQEPFINKPCVSSEVCEHDKQNVLDKIRAEIIARDKNVKAIRSDGRCFFIVEELLEIIDKYKAESEETKSADSN